MQRSRSVAFGRARDNVGIRGTNWPFSSPVFLGGSGAQLIHVLPRDTNDSLPGIPESTHRFPAENEDLDNDPDTQPHSCRSSRAGSCDEGAYGMRLLSMFQAQILRPGSTALWSTSSSPMCGGSTNATTSIKFPRWVCVVPRRTRPIFVNSTSLFQRLPEDQRDALRLIAVEERSYEEVSDTTGCAIGTLKSRVHRARLQLRSAMSGEARAAA